MAAEKRGNGVSRLGTEQLWLTVATSRPYSLFGKQLRSTTVILGSKEDGLWTVFGWL